MKRWRWRDARGMTLVEVMIALLVFSLMAGAIYSVFLTSLRAFWKGDLSTQVQQGGRVAVDRLSRDLRQARRLFSGTAGGFTFSVSGGLALCPTPQISFVLPHMGNITLAGGATIYGTDANTSGTIPYDGSYVSYYLSANQAGTPGATTLNTTGPYLNRTVYNITSTTLSTVTVGGNITALTFAAAGACPTTSSREVTVGVTASQQAASQGVSSTNLVTSDLTLRNQ